MSLSKTTSFFLILINLASLVFQLMLMGTIPSFFTFSILTLFVPIIVLINIGFALYWLVKLKWPFLLFLIVFLIGFNQWGLLLQLPKSEVRVSSNTVKVMSFNVRKFNQFNWIQDQNIPKEIQKFIKKQNPDIISFQEYSSALAPKLNNYPYRYIENRKHKSELAIFSKFPIVNKGYIDFENSTNGGSYVDVEYRNSNFRVYNLHFESLRLNLSETNLLETNADAYELRFNQVFRKQLKQVKQFNLLNQSNEIPSILCVDLNNSPFSSIYKNLISNKQDAFTKKGLGIEPTYYFYFFPLRIDFIFLDSIFEVKEFKTFNARLSDHNPIMVNFTP